MNHHVLVTDMFHAFSSMVLFIFRHDVKVLSISESSPPPRTLTLTHVFLSYDEKILLPICVVLAASHSCHCTHTRITISNHVILSYTCAASTTSYFYLYTYYTYHCLVKRLRLFMHNIHHIFSFLTVHSSTSPPIKLIGSVLVLSNAISYSACTDNFCRIGRCSLHQ